MWSCHGSVRVPSDETGGARPGLRVCSGRGGQQRPPRGLAPNPRAPSPGVIKMHGAEAYCVGEAVRRQPACKLAFTPRQAASSPAPRCVRNTAVCFTLRGLTASHLPLNGS